MTLLLAQMNFLRDIDRGALGIFFLCVGFAGQIVFGSRFIVQWIASERQKRSVIPVVFWYLSITGTLLLLSYAIWSSNPVFTLGQSANVFIYVRNLLLIAKHRRHQQARAASGIPVCPDEHCAKENPIGARFCAFCGRILEALPVLEKGDEEPLSPPPPGPSGDAP
jgi:lipid-A-disaccharide synthase-like uncharacterized protein